ncbi:glycosyltransferase family 2 protein [Desulfovibrio sp. OttesenSCG-928-I05]|nr:glycosyltransferase family 2 protein [Desulfovibrio sp. OttesenSCG-928-I05]
MNAISESQAPARLSRKGGRPLVSVIISAYNAESYLQEAIDSILAQTEGDFELLLLDDASTDGTLDVMRRNTDSRIRVLRNNGNMGIPRSFNRLLDESAGEFIAHMGADDCSMPERLATHVGMMCDDPSLWVVSSPYVFFQGRSGVAMRPVTHDAIRSEILFRCTLAQGFSLIRGEVVRKHGLRYDEKMPCAIDYDFWCRLIAHFPEARFAGTEVPLGKYRVHRGQVSLTKRAEQVRMTAKAWMHIFRALGFSTMQKEIAYHTPLYHVLPMKSAQELRQTFVWATMLKDANERSGLFEQTSFSSALLQRLVDVVNACPQYRDAGTALLAWFSDSLGLDARALFPSLYAAGDAV